jgi:hypothetical protein
MRYLGWVIVLTLGLCGIGLCPTRADDAEMVKDKLFQAKKDYDAELQKFRKAVFETFDRREEEARKKGDKKQVDQVKAERNAFEKTGESPQMVPSSIREPVTAARTKLDKAYTVAIKEYVRLKMDDAAGATEREQREIKLSSAILIGKRAYTVAFKHYDIKPDLKSFANDGNAYIAGTQIKIKIDGDLVPHSIFLHPPAKGFSQVSYPLGGRWKMFRSTIGVPKAEGNIEDPRSPLTFEVIGDGKSLWKSEPVTKREAFQTCTINIEKVKALTLRVHCENANNYAWAFWFEPILAE